MTDLHDMTHEELAIHARSAARQTGDTDLAEMARRLQDAVDDEEPSAAIAREIIAHLTA